MIYLCINLYKSMAKVGIIFRFCKFFLVFFSKTLKILLVFGHFYRLRSIFLHFFDFLTVRMTGLEPARHKHQILSLARLPIPPQALKNALFSGLKL